MKTTFKILIILLGAFILSLSFTKQASAQQSDVTLQVFYDELSPYGQWLDHPRYGYVWIPDEEDFAPYSTNGYWVLSTYGWTWMSEYDWGWAPFHYGRWARDSYYGWFWVPDTQWGPAWVTWRQANGYYGWSPMQPNMNISISFGKKYNISQDFWVFVLDRDIQRHNINKYYVDKRNRDRIIQNSTVINRTSLDKKRNSIYVAGPDRGDVQRITGKKLSTVTIHDNNRPGQTLDKEELQIYRPRISREKVNGRQPVPSKIVTPGNVKSEKIVQHKNSESNQKQKSGQQHESERQKKHKN